MSLPLAPATISDVQEKDIPHLGDKIRHSLDLSSSSYETCDTHAKLPAIEEDGLHNAPPTTARDLVVEVLSLEDDPTVNPWTFRTWFIGIGLSIFAACVTTINIFKPQIVLLQTVFVAVLSYVIGNAMAIAVPRIGPIGRILNPGPFNKKEHTAICIMVAAASSPPEAMVVLAVQKLFYNIRPSAVVGIFLVMSTQMMGYGLAGLMRSTLVYPSKMLYPMNIPSATLLESMHLRGPATKKKLKVFYIAFFVLFVWQTLPQYIMPVLAGVSIFCLTHPHSLLVTRLFGGSMANEGLGLGSLSFDWSMITSGANPLWMPLQTQCNTLLGYLLSIALYVGLYYGNMWNAKRFPFISQLMFSNNSTARHYIVYNQSAILDHKYTVQDSLLATQGLPNITASYSFGMTVRNIGITGAISHMIFWHWDDIKGVFAFLRVSSLGRVLKPKTWNLRFWKWKSKVWSKEEADAICPHFGLMQAYDEVPAWWFAAIWIISVSTGLATSMVAGSTLPVWAFFVAVFLSASSLVFFAALTAMFGFHQMVQPLIQMIGAYLVPGRPLANMYFATFGFNSLYQAKHLLKDMKLGQYLHLAPKCTFTMQVFGTCIGCICSYAFMQQITTEKRDILMAIQGTNVWSGQLIHAHNSASIGWGGLASKLYSVGGKYPWVSLSFLIGLVVPAPFWVLHKFYPKWRLDYWNTAIIASAMGILDHGTHAGLLLHYVVGFTSQLYLRKYKTDWFLKYNYVLSAGLDGGAAFINFVLTFAVFGAGGKVIAFPKYWGNNWQSGNYDYCMRDPGLGGIRRRH